MKQKLNLDAVQGRGQGKFCCNKERHCEREQGHCSIGLTAPARMGRMRAANTLAAVGRTS